MFSDFAPAEVKAEPGKPKPERERTANFRRNRSHENHQAYIVLPGFVFLALFYAVLAVDKSRLKNTLFGLTKEGWPPVRGGISRSRWRGSETSLTEIRLKKGEAVDKALRRLKKKIDREGTLKVVRNHRHFEKPSERRRRKEKAARFSAMLSARYADL